MLLCWKDLVLDALYFYLLYWVFFYIFFIDVPNNMLKSICQGITVTFESMYHSSKGYVRVYSEKQ